MKDKFGWLAMGVGLIAFIAIINNLNGAADREAAAAQIARDSIRVIVVADSVQRVADLQRFEDNLALAREDARVEREARAAAERNRRAASAQRDSLDSIVAALPDTATVVPRELYDSARVAADRTESALIAINQTLVADTVRLSDLLAEATNGWMGEIESHNLTRLENDANRNLAEAWERAANPGFLSKLWDGKEEFLLGAVVGAVLIGQISN